MAKLEKLSNKLARALKKRGWTPGHAASRTVDLGRQSIMNILNEVGEPPKLSAKTVVQLVDLLHPDVTLADFVGEEYMGALVVKVHRKEENED